jgi:hypothetical protein
MALCGALAPNNKTGRRHMSNLPPGVSENDIPGNRPEDEEEAQFWTDLNNKFRAENPPAYDQITHPANRASMDDAIMAYALMAYEMGKVRGYADARDDAEVIKAMEESESPWTLAQQADMQEAHAQGMHDDLPREGCPDCPPR